MVIDYRGRCDGEGHPTSQREQELLPAAAQHPQTRSPSQHVPRALQEPQSLLARGQEAARTEANGGLTPEASHRQRRVLVGCFSSPLAGEPGESPFPAPHLSYPHPSCRANHAPGTGSY